MSGEESDEASQDRNPGSQPVSERLGQHETDSGVALGPGKITASAPDDPTAPAAAEDGSDATGAEVAGGTEATAVSRDLAPPTSVTKSTTSAALIGRWLSKLRGSRRSSPPLDPAEVVRDAGHNSWGIAARSLALGLLLGISLVAWVQFSFDSLWVTDFLSRNRLDLDKRMTLIATMLVGGIAGFVIVAGNIAYNLKQRRELVGIERWLWFLSPLTLAPTVPLLLRHQAWENNHENLLPAVLFVALCLELFVFKCLSSVPEVVRRVVETAKSEAPLLLRRHAPLVVVMLAATAYAVFMSFYTIQWHHKLGTGSYDLGINNNLMYGGLVGDFNESRIVFPEDPGKYIANHVKIGAYVFLPIYALAPRPETLQVIQSSLLGLGAVPLFLFARRYVTQWMAVTIALAWLAYYPMHGANFYEVKWVPVAAFFVLTTVWAADAKRWIIMGIAAAIGILLREDMPPGFAVIGFFLLLSGHRPIAGLIMALVASGWFVLLRFYIMEEAGEWWFPKMYKDLWAQGETGFRSVVKTLVSNPFFTLSHVLVEKKLIYLMHLLVPLVFLPARRWYLWAAFLPGAILTLLVTDYKPVTMFSFQYVMHWAPYMFLAIPLALAAYQREAATGRHRARAALAGVAFCAGILSYNYGAFSARDGALKSGYHSITFSMSDEERERYAQLLDIISSIPPDASVAASEKIGPHVSSRRVFYSLRRDSYHADYVIVRRKGLRLDRTKQVVTNALTSGEYGVFRRVGEFVLLKRGHPDHANLEVIDEWRLKRPHTKSPGLGPTGRDSDPEPEAPLSDEPSDEAPTRAD